LKKNKTKKVLQFLIFQKTKPKVFDFWTFKKLKPKVIKINQITTQHYCKCKPLCKYFHLVYGALQKGEVPLTSWWGHYMCELPLTE